MAAAFAHRRKTLESHPCALPRAEGRFYRQQTGKAHARGPTFYPPVFSLP